VQYDCCKDRGNGKGSGLEVITFFKEWYVHYYYHAYVQNKFVFEFFLLAGLINSSCFFLFSSVGYLAATIYSNK
jgi:hypothetical protein